ncbi:MAG TPA: 16S rRNA (guanine(527)-N(7))-methyltransferase RsmG [Dehalococcoidia bacterium]|nr:16S rRNA (guanine(527)-N(7))-methyltransferase RsmG [Dehalococcoidia bacterium]
MSEAGFAEEARRLGVALDQSQVQAFQTYRDLIAEAATRFNLTAVRDPREIESRHFLEALALGRLLLDRGVMTDSCEVIDVGTGAGFPGLPLKVAWPRISLALVEANGKRCSFLRQAIARLGLDGVRVLEGRAEDWGREPEHRDAYALAVARAVAPLPVLLEYTLPFLRPGGWLAAQKGSAAPRELEEAAAALRELRAEVAEVLPFSPPGGRLQSLVLVRKLGPTPERYPRRPGVPARRPIV